MEHNLAEMEVRILQQIIEASTAGELEHVRIKYLGRKGEISALLKNIGNLAPEQRPAFGAAVNALRNKVSEMIASRKDELDREALEQSLLRDAIDVSLPGEYFEVGGLHPLTKSLREITSILSGMGFTVYESRETETDEMNFVKLNIAQGHPARDMQETFYLTETTLMRTHTSPGQIRGMLALEGRLPVRFIVPGRVYRRDPTDASHHPVFFQVEGLAIDVDVTFKQLRGVISTLMNRFFGQDVRIRLRPSYFPFTEPSCEVDISCVFCRGEGCSVCGGSGYLEVAGAGMVHPQVLLNGGYDPDKVSGFAFGFGLDRLAMLKYGIDDIRLLYGNDKRFLSQFRGL
ncbi:MAG: phenylalanine--tRNA ligase subunit alpha [Bacillota bacterium]|jgi:phenylalanyl-tRNA synthetase alpha chain|nr:phenylalanine--tRNA ligase subunit alpha [Candidatus Fermentithermobacillaceae bacterium]